MMLVDMLKIVFEGKSEEKEENSLNKLNDSCYDSSNNLWEAIYTNLIKKEFKLNKIPNRVPLLNYKYLLSKAKVVHTEIKRYSKIFNVEIVDMGRYVFK